MNISAGGRHPSNHHRKDQDGNRADGRTNAKDNRRHAAETAYEEHRSWSPDNKLSLIHIFWLQADYVDGKILFKGESDAVIVKGIVSLLISILSDHTPQEILDADLYFIEKIGLKEHLSPTRSNGLVAVSYTHLKNSFATSTAPKSN